MSKISFSKKMSDSLYKKIKSFLYLDYNNFFDYDEYFELALCMSYMTLSKEKIIKKDMKNIDRLERLTKYVDDAEIDKVFEARFNNEMPNIIYAKENNNLWILDNIRDSIMHGTFEVDDDKKVLIINNTQHDRELQAEIPFSWFIAYTKNDILSKRRSTHWTIKGFYYNLERQDFKHFSTKKEIINNIMYKVKISSDKYFNTDIIQDRVLQILDEVSKKEISEDLISKYKNKIQHKLSYSDRYIASFGLASELVKSTIEKEFPGIKVKIMLDDKKYKLSQNIEKHLSKAYSNYNLVIKELNCSINKKSYELISYIKKILINLEPSKFEGNKCYQFNQYNITNETLLQFINRFDNMLGNNLKYSDNKNRFKSIHELLLNILINVYGLTTLVINHGDFYNDEFLGQLPSDLLIQASTKQPIIDYENNQRIFLEQILDTEIKLFELKKEYLEEPTKNKSKKIKKLEEKLNDKKIKFSTPAPESVKRKEYYGNNDKILTIFNSYIDHFYKANNVEAKEKIKSIILCIYDKKIQNEIDYSNAILYNMKDTLTIIRNCFSHIGRIYIGQNKGIGTTLIMHDYNNNHAESGQVIVSLGTMINILRKPFENKKQL